MTRSDEPCSNCGRTLRYRVRDGRSGIQRYRDGWCDTCWKRWKRLGSPDSGPGQPASAADRQEHWDRIRKLAQESLRAARRARVEDAVWLRDNQHLGIPAIAQRMGLSEQTIWRYLSGH